MPALPGYIAVALASAGWTTAAVVVANITISQIITAALLVNGLVRARRARKAGGAGLEQNLKDRTLTLRSAVAPREIVYGRARIGCVMIRKPFTSGEHGQLLHMQLALRAGHEVESIDDIWLGDESIGPLNSAGEVTSGRFFKTRIEKNVVQEVVPSNGQITLPHVPSAIDSIAARMSAPNPEDAASYMLAAGHSVSGRVVTLPPGHVGRLVTITYQYVSGVPMVALRKFNGSPFGERDEWLEAHSGGVWKPTHVGRGVPRLHITFAYDPDVFPSGIPEVTVIVKGKRAILDTRTGVTLAWSDNAALCARDYLVDELGFAENPAYINAAAASAAANVCDEMIPIAAGAQKRYTCNGVISTADNRLDNLALIATSMVGNAVYTGGEWVIQAGAYSAPVMDLSDDDLTEGSIELVTETPTRDIFNSVRGKIVDPARGYQETDFPPYDSAAYIAEDGEKISQDVVLPMTDDATRAQRIAKMILHVSRQSMGLAASFTDKAARLRPGETVRLTIGIFGHELKTFRIVDRRFLFPGVVRLTLKETAPEPYAWNYAEAKDYDPTPNTVLPRPWFVPALENMQVASGSSYTRLMQDGKRQAYLRVTWEQSADIGVLHGGRIEVYIKRAIALEYDQFELDGSDTAFEFDVADDETYNIAVRARNGSNVRGNYTIATHTVVNAYISPQGINYLGEFETHPTTGLDEGAIYRNSVNGDVYIYSAGAWSVFLESGDTAKLLVLNTSSMVVQVAKTGALTPEEITFTASGQNLNGAPAFAVVAGTATLAGTGATRTIAASSIASDSVTVRATQDGQFDESTVIKLREGSDAVTCLLTNEAHTVAADSAGVVASWAGVQTDMDVYVGLLDDGINWSFTQVASNITATLNNTPGSADRGRLVVTAMPTAATSGYVDITAAKAGFPSQTKRFVVAKSRQGTGGAVGANGVRGSAHVYLSGYSVWSQAPVDAYFASTYGGKVANDAVTVYGTGFSQTRLWTGSAWQQVTVALDGSLLIVGSTPGDRVTPGTITGDRNVTPPVGGLSVTPDPGFEDLSLWSLNGSAVRIDSTPWGKFGRFAIIGDQRGAGYDVASLQSLYVPISAKKQYRASALMSAHNNGNRVAFLFVAFATATMGMCATAGAGWPSVSGYNRFFGLIMQNPGALEREFSIVFGPGTGVEIPPDAAQMAVGCLLHFNDGTSRSGNNSVSGLRIQVVSDTELIAPYAATNVLSAASVAGLIPAVADYTILSLVVANPSDQDAEVSVAGGFNAGSDRNAWIVGNLQADGGISGSTGTSLADRQQVPISVSGRRTLAAKSSITVYLRVTIRVPGDPEGSGGIRVSEGVVGNGTYSYAFLRAELIKR